MTGTATTSPRSAKRFLVKLTAVATLGGFLFGYDAGVISGALLYLQEDLQMTALQEGVVVSCLLFGAMFGALGGGKVADAIGRRWALILCAATLSIGALGSAFAPSYELLVVARVLLGLGVGGASVTVPVLLAELAPAERRGRIVTINELMIVTGQFMAFVMNSLIDQLIQDTHAWRWMLGVAVVPAVAMLAGMSVLPDSPRWYALKGRLSDARRVLEMSRTQAEAESEYNIVVEHAEKKVERGAALHELRKFPWMRRLLWIGMGIAIASQLTGVNTIFYFAPTILASTGVGSSAALALSIAVGAVSIVSTLFGIWLLGRYNNRPLLLTGYYGIAISLATIALVFLLPDSLFRTFAVLGGMILFMFFMQCFVGIGTWLLLSELFPMAIRGFAMGVSVFCLWTTNTILSFSFPMLNATLGGTGVFGILAVINLITTVLIIRFLPETKGRTLEQFEEEYAERHGGEPSILPSVSSNHPS
ncbi:sugar porter family MFS transporter [Paenarthrobacter sp. NPDC089714]|uniref:sugar porter family MFS transporter n=1 Tax=Paenarthrobacter sp. NPDC089714 TaxID=3364377 RepID=UPI003828EE57